MDIVAEHAGDGPGEATIEHARAGYENAQGVIQFLDTKSGAIIGIGTILVGVPIVVLQSIIEAEATSTLSVPALMENSPLLCQASLLGATVGVLFGTAALIRCLHSLNARGPAANSAVSILFPSFSPARRSTAAESFARMQRGLTQAEIVADYEAQLLQIGTILSQKIRCVRSAVRLIEFQFAAYIIALFCLVASALTSP